MADVIMKGFKTKADLECMKNHAGLVSDCTTEFAYVYDHNIVSAMREIGLALRAVLKNNPNAQIVVEVK